MTETPHKSRPPGQRILGLSRQLMGVLKAEHFTRIPDASFSGSVQEVAQGLLDALGVSVKVYQKDQNLIPAEGPFIAVANHPLGGVDGLLMLKLMAGKRPDILIAAHFIPSKLEALQPYFFPLHQSDQKDFSGGTFFKMSQAHLAKGGGVVLFPAAAVSAYNLKARTVRDKLWKPDVINFVHTAGVPVLPVFIKGSNKLLAHLLSTINPRLVDGDLPLSIFGKKEREVGLRIGKPLKTKDLAEFGDANEFGRFLRAKLYMLESGISVKPFFRPILFKKKWKEVVLPRDAGAINQEIAYLKTQGAMLHESKDLQVYWAHSEWIPNILYEIGRLREITFRAVGEGTGKNIDLDEYDLYYRHLFIWDSSESKLVGAYRLGMGKEIMQRLGKRGFYLHSLFRMRPAFEDVLLQSIELGRSFIAKEYQLKPLPLFLLWKGILYFILKHPEYRYLIGPVSISGEFSKLSKYLIISFIITHYYDDDMAALVSPRNEYIPEVNVDDPDMDALRQMTEEDIKKLDRIIEEIEMGNFRLPALLKKYLGQRARIIAFNVDPKFNNALDGLLVMDLFNVPAETLYGLAKEFDDKELLKKFANRNGGKDL